MTAQQKPARDFEAVVIGGSAGGITALQRLLKPLPAKFPLPIAIVLHIPPDRASGVPRLLSMSCALPVIEALDKQPFSPGTVVVAPPDYHLLLEPERCVSLSCDDPVVFSRPAIDPLFESAADAYGPKLLAILLTGASTDGRDGIAAVRKRGGTAWVQDPRTAEAPTMPAAAIAFAGADEILDLDTLAAALAGLQR
jgi:two-component system chemotaxis response regulator CheB